MKTGAPKRQRLSIAIRGAVQGVGFRPFVYRLATELKLSGWVNNSAQGVCIEVEGPPSNLNEFLVRLAPEKPPRSFIQSLEAIWLDACGYTAFDVRRSDSSGARTALVLPDIATCSDCLREILDPSNRRFGYPFTNCTNCGPRFSIIRSLPYDRAATSMSQFSMCPQCQAEYDNPLDRRFHAQPNACPACGPRVEFWDAEGRMPEAGAVLADGGALPGCGPLEAAAVALRAGAILAVKGLGGFHLMVAAHVDEAVRRLRERKHREEKPFALLFPSLSRVKEECEVDGIEERLLCSPEAPIVLLRRGRGREGSPKPAISSWIAPSNPNLGVMLPSNPLHHLLLRALGFPVVATSGNLSDEPICTEEAEALVRLRGIADYFLVHNRPIVRHVDDSIVRVMLGRELVLRRARGYAPLPVQLISAKRESGSEPSPLIPLPTDGRRWASATSGQAVRFNTVGAGHDRQPGAASPAILAVGAHLKNSVALAVGPHIFISQHIGDLETAAAFEAFGRVTRDLQHLYHCQAGVVAADLHPDYLSTQFARQSGLPVIGVQHHYAHVLACMAENDLQPPVLGVCWDGTGYGLDATVWGGEFLLVTGESFDRAGHFAPFRLPGGEAAVREPRRVALGLLHQVLGDAAFDHTELAPVRAFFPTELSTLKTALNRQLNAPLTSSVGRLFDGVASLAGLRQRVRFEGQAAMELEFALQDIDTTEHYEFILTERAVEQNSASAPAWQLDWRPLVSGILQDAALKTSAGIIAARFHNALVEALVAMAGKIGEPRVLLTGGCFQNRYLTERAVLRLKQAGFNPYWHQRVPPNDGGIALGQIVAARRSLG